MKKIIAVTAVMMLGTIYAYSQASLSFCTYVNNTNQECVFNNTKFITAQDSTHARLFLMLRSAEVFATKQLTYKVFAIDRFDKEVFLFDVNQEVDMTWMNAWQPVVFTTPGKYIVKVFRDPEQMVTSRGFELFNN